MGVGEYVMNWEDIKTEWETTKITLKDLAAKHDVKLGTMKSRKSREKWSRDPTKKDATKTKKVATPKQEVATTKKESVLESLPSDELTDKQRLFCMYYLKYYNATKAYQKAYEVDYFSAMSAGSRLLRNVKVSNEIDMLKEEQANGVKLEVRAVLQKYIDIAFADITDFVEFGTEEVPGGELEEELTGVDQSYIANYVRFKVDQEVDGTIITEVKKGKDGVSIKLADKMKALEMLSKYFDLLSDNDKKRLQEEKLKADIAKLKAEIEKLNSKDDDSKEKDVAAALRGLVDGINSKTN
ncbi:terminase small subunit [Virgibacillus halodenitrificans]|uniref:terminase small subunit n=1 Tax=Virgibacillus halodenitrificans TaxID=1482 RepID=UPI001FB26713|nr:terminase small subunit [Virgibacillus halodenitrificans]MCJ0932936.1 terminase small subunit [Virgibacillus halodenitrificans]